MLYYRDVALQASNTVILLHTILHPLQEAHTVTGYRRRKRG